MDEKTAPNPHVCKKCTGHLVIGIVIGIVIATLCCLVYFLVIADNTQDGLGLTIGTAKLPAASKTVVEKEQVESITPIYTTFPANEKTKINPKFVQTAADSFRFNKEDVIYSEQGDVYIVSGYYATPKNGKIPKNIYIPAAAKSEKQTDAEYVAQVIDIVKNNAPKIAGSGVGNVGGLYDQEIEMPDDVNDPSTLNDIINIVVAGFFNEGMVTGDFGVDMGKLMGEIVVEADGGFIGVNCFDGGWSGKTIDVCSISDDGRVYTGTNERGKEQTETESKSEAYVDAVEDWQDSKAAQRETTITDADTGTGTDDDSSGTASTGSTSSTGATSTGATSSTGSTSTTPSNIMEDYPRGDRIMDYIMNYIEDYITGFVNVTEIIKGTANEFDVSTYNQTGIEFFNNMYVQ